MKTPTAAAVWRIAATPHPDVEFERVLAMSDEEVRKSLVEHGYDLRVLSAEAKALWSQHHRTRKLPSGFIAGGIGVVGSIGLAISTLMAPVVPEALPYLATAASPPPAVTTSARDEALAACRAGRWEMCLAKLDGVNEDPEVVVARALAEQKLAEGGKP